MAHLYQAPSLLPALCTSQYSILQQERLYLLQALAIEDARDERLTKAFEMLKSKLEKSETAEPPIKSKRLKQAIKSVQNKIVKCQFRERTLAMSLSNIAVQMEGMKRCQWRNGQQNQYGQMMMSSPVFPNFTLQSPLTGNVTTQMQYMAMTSPTQSQEYLPPGSYYPYLVGPPPQIPQRPFWLPSTFNATPAGYHLPINLQVSLSATEQSEAETASAHSVGCLSSFDLMPLFALPAEDSESQSLSPRSRGWQRPWSWQSVDNSDQGNNNSPSGEAQPAPGGLGRRLSILNATSSGIRLDKLSRKGAGQRSM